MLDYAYPLKNNIQHEINALGVAMNVLPIEKRAQIMRLLVEGNSMRAIARIADVSINTVTKLLVDAGTACLEFQDEATRNIKSKRVQCDEIWSFCGAIAQGRLLLRAESLLPLADLLRSKAERRRWQQHVQSVALS